MHFNPKVNFPFTSLTNFDKSLVNMGKLCDKVYRAKNYSNLTLILKIKPPQCDQRKCCCQDLVQ